MLGHSLRRQIPPRPRHFLEMHRRRVDGLVLTQHAWQFGTKRVGEWKDGAHSRRTLAAREGGKQSERWQRDLFLPHEVGIQYRDERARRDTHLSRRPGRGRECLMDLPVLGANRSRDLEKALRRSSSPSRMLCSQGGHEREDRESTDDGAAI